MKQAAALNSRARPLFRPLPSRTTLTRRRFHKCASCTKDDTEQYSATRPTAESIILQRISTPTVYSSSPVASTTSAKDNSEAKTTSIASQGDRPEVNNPLDDSTQQESIAGSTNPTSTAPTIASVSNIIRDLRETRAAQRITADDYLSLSMLDDEDSSGAAKKHKKYFFRRDLFDSYTMVESLATSGFTRAQSAEIMRIVRHRVRQTVVEMESEMLTKSDLENDAYLFKASLEELRTETQVTHKNNQALLESRAAAVSRDIEAHAQRTNDEIANLRSDIEIELNNRRHDTNHALKHLDMELHELASRYQMVVGDMKTDIEAIRLDSIRRGLIAAVVTALVVVGAAWWLPSSAQESGEEGAGGGEGEDGGGKHEDALPSSGIEDYHMAVGGVHRLNGPLLPAGSASQLGAAHPLVRHGQWGGNAASGPAEHTQSGGDGGSGRAAQGSRYVDHRHLNIHYDPTISSADTQFGSLDGPQTKQVQRHDDWFDSFFYPMQDIADQRRSSGKSASLMDTDSTLDSTFWDTVAMATGSGAPGEKRHSGPKGEKSADIPMLFTPNSKDKPKEDAKHQ